MASGLAEHQRALPEVVEDQRRLHHDEPGDLDRLAPEVAEIGVERLGAGDGQEHEAQTVRPIMPCVRRTGCRARIERGKTRGSSMMWIRPPIGERGEPHHDDRAERLRHLRRSARLHGKQHRPE